MIKEVRFDKGRVIATTRIIVNGISPQRIYDFMLTLNNEKFHNWHPEDHIEFKIIKQSPQIIGNIFYFHEFIGGKYRLQNNWRIVKYKKDEMLLMKAQVLIPVFLKLSFLSENENTLVSHQLQIGFKWLRFINNLIAKHAFSPGRQLASDIHARQEFKNLEVLLK